jgi:molybdopterin converting factor small subunit
LKNEDLEDLIKKVKVGDVVVIVPAGQMSEL